LLPLSRLATKTLPFLFGGTVFKEALSRRR
jgi:hypothetical protein